MYTQSRNRLLATAVALAIATSSVAATAATTPSQDVTNARQESQIWTTYALSPFLRANDLKVSVHEGKATLTGNVEESVNKDLAEQIALGVNGIKDVDNQIKVQADYTPPARSADRSYGEVIDDASITSAVKSKLVWSKNTEGLTANVETKRGKVTLVGSADSAATKDLAGKLAMGTRGVMSVDNQLVVKSAKAGTAATAMSSTQEVGKRHDRRLDYHESEVHLHVLQQCRRVRYLGEYRQGRRHAERQGGQRCRARPCHRARAERARRQERPVEGADALSR